MNYFDELEKDVRLVEGLSACINCGTCTAICPAAQFYDYDPRNVVDIVQSQNNSKIEALLKSDTIWMCGECLSCKTRCPRNNVPGYVIQALRALSIETGLFVESEKGRQQLALKRTIGEHILKYGYCVYFDEINLDMYPEQGPVWEWMRKNSTDILERLGANYKGEGPGTLRKISQESLNDLQAIFDLTGATDRFNIIEKYSEQKADELGIAYGLGTNDDYFNMIYNGENI